MASTSSSLIDQCVPDPQAGLGGVGGEGEAPHSGLFMHLLKSLMPGQDLTRVMIPSFFLEPRSLLERMADLVMHPQLLLPYVVKHARVVSLTSGAESRT